MDSEEEKPQEKDDCQQVAQSCDEGMESSASVTTGVQDTNLEIQDEGDFVKTSPQELQASEPMDDSASLEAPQNVIDKDDSECKQEVTAVKEEEIELVDVKINEIPFAESKADKEEPISVDNVEADDKSPTLKDKSLENDIKNEEKPAPSLVSATATTNTTTTTDAGSTATSKPSSSFVIPLQSLRIPSLGNKAPTLLKVSDKVIKPTVAPTPLPPGNSALMAYSKSISSALAPPKPLREKRKHVGGCSNLNCTRTSDDLTIAPRHAILYFHFNTKLRKVFKICAHCLNDADAYIKKATRAAENGDCVLTFKTEPQGMDGDVIEVSEGEEEDDPVDVLTVEAEDKEMIELTDSFDDIIGKVLESLNPEKQMEKCENSVQQESNFLERDLVSLESKLAFVEKQMLEAKKMYDKVAGHNQPVPVVLEELDIDVNGYIRKSKGENPHFAKMADQVQESVKNIMRRKAENGEISTASKDERRRNRTKDEEGEIMEVETAQKPVESKVVLAPTPKVLPRVMPAVGSYVYALNRTLLHFWLKGEVTEVIKTGPSKPLEFIVQFEPPKKGKSAKDAGKPFSPLSKQVTSKQVAYNVPCPFILPVGARIIAKFRDELKTEPAGDGQYYAGVVAEPPKNTNNYRYLVFFDDGYAQYVHHKEVLLVCESSKEVWADVHPDSSDFIKNYVQKYPERPMVRLSVGQVVTTEWNGQWWVARVVELDCSLVKMKFESDGRNEWIYRGSTRLSPLYEKQNRQKTKATARRHVSTVARNRNQPTIEYNYGDDDVKRTSGSVKPVAKKSTSGVSQSYDKSLGHYGMRMPRYDYGEFEGTIIKKAIPDSAHKTKEYVPHTCNSSCVETFNEFDREFRKYNPLSVPLHLGWSREIGKTPRKNVFYRGPCGRRIRDMNEMYAYLNETSCGIPVDYFCFDLAVDCLNEFRQARQHSFLPDLTYGKELTPVQVVNAFDFEYPPYVEYSSSRIAGDGVTLNTDDEFLEGCDCEDDCRDKSKCSCWQLTLSGISFTKLNNEEFPLKGYEHRRLHDHIVSGVYECNSKCKCRKTCCNRVVQNGLKVPLQVFKTAAKGWGIRPLYDIPEGSFICIYAGQVLTEQGANEDGKQFGDEYLAELDYIECNEQVKADYESDVTDIEAEEIPEKPKKRRGKGKGKNGNSDDEVDSHANDSSYRGPKPTTSRTINTRNKNGKGNSTTKDDSDDDDDDDDEDDDGTRKRSRFNAEVRSYKAKKKERLPLREYFGKDEQCYIMDAKTLGNIGRYLNHSCQPNVFVQNVFVDTHDLRFPWVAFFSSKHIRAGSELTWDYNYDIGSVPDKVMYCYCASPECRGRLL